MPELPEVETICRMLLPNVQGKKIESTTVFLDRMVKTPAAAEFKMLTEGRSINGIRRRGKYIIFGLSSGYELIVHLRMTGQLIFLRDNSQEIKYIRIRFDFCDGSSLVFADLRTLGVLYLVKENDSSNIKGLYSMGPEPLSDNFSIEYLQKTLLKKRGRIKSFLLNQQNIGGLGNIYADEALFCAGIRPDRLTTELNNDEITKLYNAVNNVIVAGIDDGGTTFSDYRDGNGNKGRHQDNLYVYQRTKQPCRKCHTIIERTVIGGRSSHYCPECQK